MKFKRSILIIFTFSFLQAAAQVETRSYVADKGLIPREQSVDFTHLKMDLAFVPEEGKVMGKVEEIFIVLQREIDTLFLDAIRMNFKSVKLDGEEVEFDNTSRKLILRFKNPLTWNTSHKLEIEYEAHPKKGLYFVGWNDPNELSRKQIWSQGQGINNRHWIPMYDEKNDKVISEMLVEFDSKYKVLSNGKKLAEKKLKNGNKQWHYEISHPHAPYLIMLGIGDYGIEKQKSASGVPLNLYYYSGQENQVEPTYRYSKRMFDFFEKEIGVPYPWETYSQIPVQEFMYGAMENTTATIFGDFYLIDSRGYLDKNYVRVDAHELAHQWFGDMITARASAHHWLQESFATHYDMMYQKEAFGQDHYDWVRRDYNNQAIEESKKNLKPIAHSNAGTVRHYPKGAHVLQMLKYVVGREQFNAAIKYYLEKHAYENVNSNDLLVAFHERLGLSLNWFWEQWVYKGGEPSYTVSLDQTLNKINVNIKQVQAQNDLVGLFKMPINIDVIYSNGKKERRKVWVEKGVHSISFEMPEDQVVDFVLFDPNSEIMKSVVFTKPIEMLKKQAVMAENMIDRFDAIIALSSIDFENKASFLMERFNVEKFHGIKAEIIAQVLPQLDEASVELAKKALTDKDVNVRKAVLNNTVRIPINLEPEYRKLLQDSSYEVVAQSLELLTFYFPTNINDYLELTEGQVGNRSHNIAIQRLVLQIENTYDKEALDKLFAYTSESYEFLTRVKAAQAIQELNVLNEEALSYLLDAVFSFNSRLRAPVSKVIDHFFEQKSFKRMILNYVSSQEWTDQEFKKVSKYMVP
jgi:aminopeptidase N